MEMERFKVGDRVVVIDESSSEDRHLIGMTGKVVRNTIMGNWEVDFGKCIEQTFNRVNNTTHIYKPDELKHVQDIKNKSEDTLVRYMVYGEGCNNKSDLFTTEQELRDATKEKTTNSSWSGRIIGYKLVPLFEGTTTTVLKMFKTTKLTSIKKRR
jgi:hypothetical protein